MDLIEIKGKINTAICYARVVEDEAIEQIRRMCDYPMTEGSRIRIMPDVHSGKGCTIGTTMTITDKAVPNVVGVDIGCGMYTVNLGKVDIDFVKVDEAAHFIPSGMNVWEGRQERFDLTELACYLHDVEICQAFARRSREKMAEIILERTGMAGREAFHTIHNYVDTDEMILRKGAIAAHSGEKVLIPINMRDGSVLAVGKGNPEWNYSAPHGAGRLMSRTKAKANLSMDEYRETMKGIYTTSINENTLDEAPMAYKSLEDIIDVIRESVDVIDVMKPIYNFKASD